MPQQSRRYFGANELFDAYKTSEHGLTQREATLRLGRVGPNRFDVPSQDRSVIARFVVALSNPLVLILFSGALIALVVRQFSEAIAFISLALVHASMFFVHLGARTLAQPKDTLSQVRRDGKMVQKLSDQLVPGDIVLLEPNDIVPADGKLLTAHQLVIDETVVTGSSQPIIKTATKEQEADILSGMCIINGTAEYLVMRTGIETWQGVLMSQLEKLDTTPDLLGGSWRRLTRQIIWLMLLSFLIITTVGLAQSIAIADSLRLLLFVIATSLPVSLPIVTVFILMLTRTQLGRHGVVAQNLRAIETLGTATVLCLDTDLLIEQIILVDRIWLAPGQKGSQLEQVGRLVNVAHLDDQNKKDIGSPIDIALARWASRDAETYLAERTNHPLASELIESATARMSVIIRTGQSHKLLVRGEPEELLQRANLSAAQRAIIHRQLSIWTSLGYSIVGCAERRVTTLQIRTKKRSELEERLTFIGLIALTQTVKEGSIETIAQLRGGGIRPILVTNLARQTAAAVAHKTGILRFSESTILDTIEFDRLDRDQLVAHLTKPLVATNLTPAQKLRLVETLQSMEDTVAFAGTTLSDGPAMYQADVNLATPKSNQAVRRLADLLVTDGQITTLRQAFIASRTIFTILKTSVGYLLTFTIASIFFLLGGLLFHLPLGAMNGLLLLTLTLFVTILPTVALGSELSDHNPLAEPARRATVLLLDKDNLWRDILIGSTIGLGGILSFFVSLTSQTATLPADLLYERALMVAIVAIATSFLVASLSFRSPIRSLTKMHILDNPLLMTSLFAAGSILITLIYAQPFQRTLSTQPLDGREWLFIGSWALIVIGIDEVQKMHKRVFRNP